MGWLIALDSFALFEKFSSVELAMLIAGGLFYSVGIYFYVKQSMLYNHVIWHLFVLLGGFFHYLMIYFSIA
jgi:hemolysin III